MNKTAVKNFAVWARTTLISAVEQKAFEYDITPDSASETKAAATTAGDRLLTDTEKNQRDQLVKAISEKGFEQVMEETAYTWFNRFTALRFMEVNGYLPSYIRVFTDEENNFKPQILAEAINLEMEGLDMNKVYELRQAEKNEELYKYLLITQCNELNSVLPKMFQKIDDCTELLLPDNLLREGSVIEQMVTQIPEEDWKDEVQIIGWLYQYYISQKKDDVFAALKKNVKISKENIPAATQLFTPDWIVRYMVENSLGRMWLEGHPDSKAQFLPTEEEQKAYLAKRNGENSSENAEGCTYANYGSSDKKWHYYLEEAKQEQEVQEKLDELRKQYAAMTAEQIKVIDPCCGSGHILAYMFDVLMQIYESSGYTAREAASSIVENNLYGLDIDGRAAQLAYFSVMMKGCQYDRRFLKRGVQPRVYEIEESNHTDPNLVEYFSGGSAELKAAMNRIVHELNDAKEYGSILTVSQQDWNAVYARFAEIENSIDIYREAALAKLLPLAQVAEVMSQKYDIVVTNPPYMGASGMGAKLSKYVKEKYPDSKSDLFAVFIERCGQFVKKNGYQAMITQHAWMFLSSYEKLRTKLLNTDDISTMVHLGARAFEEIGGEVVQTTSFVLHKAYVNKYKGKYCRLIEPVTQYGKEYMFLCKKNVFITNKEVFLQLQNKILAYWLSTSVLQILMKAKKLKSFGNAKQGLATTDNKRFLRLWYEVEKEKIDFLCSSCELIQVRGSKWFPYSKGGSFRRWSSINEFIVNYENDGDEIKKAVLQKYAYLKTPDFVVKNTDTYFKAGITWNDISTGLFCCRYVPHGFIYDTAGPMYFSNNNMEMLGYFNSIVFQTFADIICQGFHYNTGSIIEMPYISVNEDDSNMIKYFVKSSLMVSESDWDSYETSWNFKHNPLV